MSRPSFANRDDSPYQLSAYRSTRLLRACEWYNQQRAGLGSRFEAAGEVTLEMISASPLSFPVVHRDVRRALVRRFPYGLFYRIRGETIHVLAVLHSGRDPALWRSRTDAE